MGVLTGAWNSGAIPVADDLVESISALPPDFQVTAGVRAPGVDVYVFVNRTFRGPARILAFPLVLRFFLVRACMPDPSRGPSHPRS